MTPRLVVIAALAAAPASAVAETAAVAVGAADDVEGMADLAADLTAILEARGFEVVAAARVEEALGGRLESEPSPGALEGMAAALGVSAFVTVFLDASDDAATVRAALFDAGPSTTLTASATGARDESRRIAGEVVGGLLDRARPAPAEEDAATSESPPPEPVADAPPEPEPPRPEPPDESPPETAAPPPPPPQESPTGRRGDARVVVALNATALGLYLMSGVLFAADVTDPRLFAPILLAGGGGGLAVSLVVQRRWPISHGDNSILGLGGWWGGATGVLVTGTAGYGELRWLMTGGLVGQAVGLAAAIATAAYTEVSAGDGAVIHSGALWGLFGGGVLATLVGDDDARTSFGVLLAGLYAGLGAGALSAHLVDISAGRAAIIDLCGFLGVLLGASVGTPIIIDSLSAGHLRAYAGVLLGAAAAGLGVGAIVTRRWDDDEDGDEMRGSTRRWRQLASVPVPMPYIIEPAAGVEDARPGVGLQLVGGVP